MSIHFMTFTRLQNYIKTEQTVKQRGFKFFQIHACLYKGELTPSDVECINNFIRSHNHTLTDVGFHLKSRVTSIVVFW